MAEDPRTWLHVLRARLGLTQVQLADRLGVARMTVNRWERRVGVPDIHQAATLAEMADVPVDEVAQVFAEAS